MTEAEDFHRELTFAMKELQGSTAWSMDRDRPYDGQPQTDCGERGKQPVEGLTMRDVADCVVMGFLRACSDQQPVPENPVYDDVYKLDLPNLDPIAVVQCAMCNIEKMMGIYPNVPRLHPDCGEEGT